MPLPFNAKYFIPIVYCAVCWIFVVVDIVLPAKEELTQHAIIPRKMKGLVGVLVAPFLNPDVYWMVTNTVGILIFGWLLLRRGLFDFLLVTITCYPLAGIVYWVVGIESAVGAGGLICAWFGYLGAIPFFEKPVKFGDLAVAVGTAIVTIGMWLYNLCGFGTGVLMSILKHKIFRKTSKHWESLISPEATDPSQPSDKTRLLEQPVANKPTTSKPTNANTNPFETA